MPCRTSAIPGLVLAALSVGAAHAHDFHLALDKCEILVGSTLDPTHPPTVVDGDIAVVSCTRREMIVSCDWVYAPGVRSTQALRQQ